MFNYRTITQPKQQQVIHRWKIPIIGLILLVLLIVGWYLRIYKLDQQAYWLDESYTILASQTIADKGTSILPSGQDYPCPVYCYPTAFLTKLFGQTAFAYRLLSVIAGVFLILVIYFVARDFFNRKAALLSAFFTTFSYWQIAWSRQARWYTLLALLFWLAIFFFWRGLNREKFRVGYLLGAFIVTVLAILTHRLAFGLPVLFIIWLTAITWQKETAQSWLKQRWKIIVTAGGLGLIAIISACYLFLGAGVFSVLTGKISLAYTLPYYLNFYLSNYWLFIVLLIYLICNSSENETRPIGILLTALFIGLIPLAFFTKFVQYRYLFHLTPVLIILGSAGSVRLIQNLKSTTGRLVVSIILISIFFVSGAGIFIPRSFYLLEADNLTGRQPFYAYTPQPDWTKAYNFIAGAKTPNDIIISTYPSLSKLLLKQNSYWLAINSTGKADDFSPTSNEARDYYTGAPAILSLAKLKTVTESQHGFIVFDYMALDHRLDPKIIDFITNSFTPVFYDKINWYSQVWVYRF